MYKDGTGRTTVDILFSRKREVDGYPWLKGTDVDRDAGEAEQAAPGDLSAMLAKSVLVMLKGDTISISSVAEGGVFVRSVSQSGGPEPPVLVARQRPRRLPPARQHHLPPRRPRHGGRVAAQGGSGGSARRLGGAARSPRGQRRRHRRRHLGRGRDRRRRAVLLVAVRPAGSRCRNTTGSNTSTCSTRSNRCRRHPSRRSTRRS